MVSPADFLERISNRLNSCTKDVAPNLDLLVCLMRPPLSQRRVLKILWFVVVVVLLLNYFLLPQEEIPAPPPVSWVLPNPTPYTLHFIYFRGDTYPLSFFESWTALNKWKLKYYTDNETVVREKPHMERIIAYWFVKEHRPHFINTYKTSTWVQFATFFFG